MSISTRYNNNPNVKTPNSSLDIDLQACERRRQASAEKLAVILARQKRIETIDARLAIIEIDRCNNFALYFVTHATRAQLDAARDAFLADNLRL